MLGTEKCQRESEVGSPELHSQSTKSHQDAVNGIAYAYNVTPQPPTTHMDPSFYPPPWAGPGYGMMPFVPPPPGMMMPGMPPAPMPGMPPVSMPPMPIDLHPNPAMSGASMNHTPMSRPREDTQRSPPALPSRERFSYTRYQVELLNAIYMHARYPNSMQKQLIAKRVGITRDQVKIWFQNRRRKDVIGKTSAKEDYLQTTARKMVPEDVIESIISELKAYENDPKGKKIKAVMNKNLDDKKRKATLVTGSASSPDFDDGDTNLSYASSESPTSIINADITESLFTEEYRPNNANFVAEVETAQEIPVSRPSYPFHSISEVFSNSAGMLPPPMAGQAMALPVITSVTSLSQSENPDNYSIDNAGDNQPPALIDIVPDDSSREPSPVLQTITPLTPVTTDSDTNDTVYTDHSPGYSEQSRGVSPVDQHQTEAFASNLDISAPPNTVVMHTHHIVPLKRRRCEDSSSEDDEEVEPPRKRQERLAESEESSPPNTIAPPSEPIQYTPINIIPTSSHSLSVDIPRNHNSPDSEPNQTEGTDYDQSRTRPPFLLAPLPVMPEPITWPPPQWAPRPLLDGQHGGYPIPPRHSSDTDFNQYKEDSYSASQPPKSCSEIAPGSFRDFYSVPQESYPWDLGSGNNNNNESSAKESCDKTIFNHYSMMSAESAKLPSYGYDSGFRYAPVSTGRHELFTPWMTPLPGSYCPLPASAETGSDNLNGTEQQ